MSKTFKHQFTYDYLKLNRHIKWKHLKGILNYFNRCNHSKEEILRWRNYKIHKRDNTNE